MRDQQEVGRREQLWSSLSEGRAPQDGEVQTIAAKIWQDAFRRDSALAWSQVEVGSPTHRPGRARHVSEDPVARLTRSAQPSASCGSIPRHSWRNASAAGDRGA
jgi:hypothetical protein